jgi:23S rRNA (uracil1939-C5)-methyltransferase
MSVTIERLGHLGDGVAAGPVFVPLTLPSEVVEGEVIGGRIAKPSIVTPSPDRVRAPCPHFATCGGCTLQHASDGFLAAWKTDVVRTALAAQGLSAPFRPTHVSPPATRRRATLAGRRTKKGALVGFHAKASDVIVAIPACILLHPDLVGQIPALERMVIAGASRKAEVAFALTRSDAGVDVAASGGKEMSAALLSELVTISNDHDLARLTWNGDLVIERRPPVLAIGSTTIVPPAGAFLQATADGQAALTEAVSGAVGSARRIVDLFAGCGTFALPLAEHAEVRAIEGDAAMLAALDAGWRRAERLKPVTTETRDLFRRPLLADELNRFDAVVIDPPRAGAEAQMRQIAASKISRVAAVSCNPVSFARDARCLCEAGFRLDWVQVVDQFRWSPHVELVARLTRGGVGPEFLVRRGAG